MSIWYVCCDSIFFVGCVSSWLHAIRTRPAWKRSCRHCLFVLCQAGWFLSADWVLLSHAGLVFVRKGDERDQLIVGALMCVRGWLLCCAKRVDDFFFLLIEYYCVMQDWFSSGREVMAAEFAVVVLYWYDRCAYRMIICNLCVLVSSNWLSCGNRWFQILREHKLFTSRPKVVTVKVASQILW